ncbi:MAG TPA: hypothetical protein VKN99_12445 [Polyangia bacterium]|nr:hypothetical protein [Polyangia bacterium]
MAALALPFALALALLQPTAQNPYLARARGEIERLRYDRARESLDAALQFGGNGPADVAEIYRLLGQVAATLGQREAAEGFFRHLLVLDPEAQLGAGVSPKIQAPFDAARAYTAEHGALRVRHQVHAGATPSIVLEVTADPLAMVAGARATYRTRSGSEQSIEGRGQARVELVLPGGPRIEVTLAALDAFGNRLLEIGGAGAPIVIEGGAEALPPAAARAHVDEALPVRQPFYKRYWFWGGLAVGAAAFGTAFGLLEKGAEDDLKKLNADSMNHDFREARAIEDRGRRDALLADIGFGVGGACAVVAVVMAVRSAGGPPRSERAQTVVIPAPTASGAGLLVQGRF